MRLKNGNVRSYKESVDHQYISSLANLKTLQQHSKAMYRDFVSNRLAHIDPDGKYGERSFVILPTDNTARLHKLLDILDLQGIDYYATTEELKVRKAKTTSGRCVMRPSLRALLSSPIASMMRRYWQPSWSLTQS